MDVIKLYNVDCPRVRGPVPALIDCPHCHCSAMQLVSDQIPAFK